MGSGCHVLGRSNEHDPPYRFSRLSGYLRGNIWRGSPILSILHIQKRGTRTSDVHLAGHVTTGKHLRLELSIRHHPYSRILGAMEVIIYYW